MGRRIKQKTDPDVIAARAREIEVAEGAPPKDLDTTAPDEILTGSSPRIDTQLAGLWRQLVQLGWIAGAEIASGRIEAKMERCHKGMAAICGVIAALKGPMIATGKSTGITIEIAGYVGPYDSDGKDGK